VKTLWIWFIVLSCAAALYVQPLVTFTVVFGVVVLMVGLRLFGMLSILIGDIMFSRWR